MKKVLHIIPGFNGGAEIIFKKIYKFLEKNKINGRIFYFSSLGKKMFKKLKKEKIFCFRIKGEVVYLGLWSKLREFLRSDYLHIHHVKTWILFSPFFLFKNKIIYSFHGNFGAAIKKDITQNIFIYLIINYCTLVSKKLIFLTKGQEENLMRYTLFKKKFLKKSEVINNFIDKKNIIRKKKRYNNNILFVGRYERRKGFYDLLEISKIIKDVNFKFIGGNKINTKQKNIKNYGKIDNHKILKYYDNSSIFILPSYTEAFPLTILEAMARGLVILVSDIPGMREIVKEGRNGYLFPPGDIEKMKELILYLKNNPKEIERISKNNLKDVHKFTAEKQVPKYIKVYNDVLKEKC